jgi:hypothetical protein
MTQDLSRRVTEDDAALRARESDMAGRVVERLADGDDGRRRYRARLINAGESKNRRLYPESVLHQAAALYNGARVYDHHRTDDEVRTSTVEGMIGSVRDVEAVAGGLDGTVELLTSPRAAHVAGILDASLEAEGAKRPPLAGLSHDVLMRSRRLAHGVTEAIAIDSVLSVDVVADPAAGGRATRHLAGGLDVKTLKDLLKALSDATDEAARTTILQSDEAKAILEAAGLDAGQALRMAKSLEPPKDAKSDDKADKGKPDDKADDDKGDPDKGTEPRLAPDQPAVPPDAKSPELVGAAATEAASLTGRAWIREALDGLPEPIAELVRPTIPATFTERALKAHVALVSAPLVAQARAVEAAGRSAIGEVRGGAVVVDDEWARKVEALDGYFGCPAATLRYRSIREAWADLTGYRSGGFLDAEDVNRRIVQESVGSGDFDSVRTLGFPRPGEAPADARKRSLEAITRARGVEALTASSWNLVLGDSITRRMIAEYAVPSLDTWRRIVSSVVSVSDFRTQRLDRIGGYGILPAVGEGVPYQPLTSPGNEEVTYGISKRGGLEEVTLEMIANDDQRAVASIPRRLGRAAAHTLFRFVWDFIDSNPLIYDGVALFDAAHLNTTATALSSTAVETSRIQMRRLAAYGNALEILGLTPQTLITVANLETLAWQLCTSAVALPSGSPVGAASNTPNIHNTMTPLVVDYWASTTKWILVANPADVPTMEVGFYQGREAPELFTQSDPSVGSMFNADKVTYKIRHIYGAAVLDYRGFSRGNS